MNTKLLLLFLFSLFTIGVDAQVTTNFSGTLTNSQYFKRPVAKVEDDYTVQLYAADVKAGTVDYNYFTQTFTPAVSGTYTVKVTSTTVGDSDTFLIVYNGTFNAASPLTNFMQANDDTADDVLSSVNNISLTGGVTYTLVMTTYNPGQTGNVNFSVIGAGGVVVGNNPAITSAAYDASTGILVVTGSNFQAKTGSANDVDVSKLSILGQGGSSRTLTTGAVEITSATSFTVTLNSADRTAVNALLNKNGTTSVGGTTYNLAAAAGWMANATSVADLTGNGITVSNVAAANTAPTNISLSASTINENVAANSTVGTLSSTDADAANTFTYSLVSGTGDTNNADFNISGNSLRINVSPDYEAKSSYSVRIRTTDQGGLTYEKVFNITINNLNEAPTDIALSATSINENVAANSTVGTLSSTDADASNTFTYTLVSGTGSTDNAAFNISGNNLQITASPDFETKSSYAIRIRSTDQGGLSFEKEFTITINNTNDAPTLAGGPIVFNPTTVGSNSQEISVSDMLASLTYSDQDASAMKGIIVVGVSEAGHWQFTNGNASDWINASSRPVSATNGVLLSASDRIFYTPGSTAETAFITFRAWDQTAFGPTSVPGNVKLANPAVTGGTSSFSTGTANATIVVGLPNTAPTNISLSATSINENVAANATVGTLSTTDADAANTFTYTLVSGTGSTDNSAFNISGNSLRITASPDFENQNSYSVRIRTTDQGGLTYEKVFNITINDLNEAPTDIFLSSTSVAENVSANTTVATLSPGDPDSGGSHSYSLVSGTGDTDNAAFNISGNSLRISASPDFETKSSYSIRLRNTDQDGLTFDKVVTINITNVNEAPADIALSATSINENVAANSTVGTLSSTDVDASNTFTYTLVSGTGSTDNLAFNISGSSLRITASPDFETKNSYSVRVRTTDQGGLSFEKVFTVTINNVNEAPTDVALSASAINENVAANAVVGTLSSTDVDASNTFTYTLVAGTGSTDNAAFNINGNSLRITASPDFEAKNSYSVRVRTTDQGGLTFEKAFTINVNDVNEAPTAIALSATTINENVAANSIVGTLSSTDTDASNTFTYALVSGTGSTDNAAFNISGNSLRISASPDFETKNSYSVRIRTTDQDGSTYEKAFTISITNVNETPTDLTLSATSINENVAANSTVGTLSTTDQDASNTFTYTLVTGTGDSDNAAFNISGSSLRINASPDYETKNTYSVRVRTTDQGGLSFEKALTININDVTELIFTTTSLPNATVGVNYEQQISVTVGASPYTFALASGTLPAGLTLSADGKISGTATAGGTFNINVRATDQNSVTATKAYTLTVAAPTLTLTASLPNANVGASYSQTITTNGGTAPYTYSLTQGTLPPGLSLSTAGVLTGTPTLGGTFNFTVGSTDSSTGSGPYVNTKAYTLIVDPATQTITFNANGTATYGDADFDPAATSTNSSINITYSSSDQTIATIVNNKVHIVKAGTVTIYADQAANVSYTAAVQKQQTLVISPKMLTVSLTGNVIRAYNGNANATLTAAHFALAGKVGTDDVSIAIPATATYNDKNVGTGKLVSATALTLDGSDRGNYQLSNTTASANIGLISAKAITVTLNSTPLISKVYDRSSSATLVAGNYTLVDVETGDDVSVSGNATYDSPSAGTGKTITVNTFVLAGSDKGNYSLTTTTATTTGEINAKQLTVALNPVPTITKVYNGDAIATLVAGNYALTGVQVGDVVTVSATAAYDDKAVGTGKTVTARSFVLGGADKDNYSLTTTVATTTGTVTAKPITLALNAAPAISKTYDANTNATLVSANYSLMGLIGADEVTVNGTANYNNATVGTGKTVTANAFVLAGAAKNNYNLTTTSATTTGAITAKPITVALNAVPAITKVYDGNANATLAASNYTLTGVEGGDAVAINGTATYSDKNVASGKVITVNAFVLSGADQANYSLTTTSATTTGAITAKPITLSLNATPLITKVYNGNAVAALASNNYSLTGVVSGDAVSVSGTANYSNATAGTSKTITANGFALAGVDKDNYNLTTTTATTTGDIAKANLVITAENKTRVQNTPNPTFTATYAGFVNGETSAVFSSQPTFSTTATLSSLPGTYPIVPTGAAAQNYNISYINGTLTVTPGAPTSITLAQATLFENRPAGTLAGTLSSTSDDPNALFTYTLVAGSGDTDNGLFAIAGQQLNTAASLNFEQKSSYSVRVRSTTQYGLTLDRVITVALTDVNEAPSFNAIANQTICATGENRTIAIGGISAGPETGQTTTFTVSSNNPALFAQLTVANNGVVSYRTADGRSGVANITVTIKDNGGTANGGVDTFSQNFTITVNQLPEVVITTGGGKVELAKGETLVLKATGGVGYNWSLAQGIIGSRNNAELTIRPEATTTYTVEATSAAGCTSTKSITIVVKEDLFVVKGTNILSPNGDGKNDRFIIRNIDMYPNNTVKIYDRAGRMVFSQKNYIDQFDGTFQGSPLAEDTYYYIVDFGPAKTKIKGFITIVRD